MNLRVSFIGLAALKPHERRRFKEPSHHHLSSYARGREGINSKMNWPVEPMYATGHAMMCQGRTQEWQPKGWAAGGGTNNTWRSIIYIQKGPWNRLGHIHSHCHSHIHTPTCDSGLTYLASSSLLNLLFWLLLAVANRVSNAGFLSLDLRNRKKEALVRPSFTFPQGRLWNIPVSVLLRKRVQCRWPAIRDTTAPPDNSAAASHLRWFPGQPTRSPTSIGETVSQQLGRCFVS